jgi:hypothetical protein
MHQRITLGCWENYSDTFHCAQKWCPIIFPLCGVLAMGVQNRLIIGAILIALIFASLLLVVHSIQPASSIKNYSEEEFLDMVEIKHLTQSVDLKSIQHLYGEGVNFISISRWPEALAACKEAVELLGEGYSLPNVLEHTGGKLIVADLQSTQGNTDNAAKIYCSVLETRIYLFQKKIGALD